MCKRQRGQGSRDVLWRQVTVKTCETRLSSSSPGLHLFNSRHVAVISVWAFVSSCCCNMLCTVPFVSMSNSLMKWSRVKTWSHCQPSDFSHLLNCHLLSFASDSTNDSTYSTNDSLNLDFLTKNLLNFDPFLPVKPTFDRCFEDMASQGCQGDVASFSSLVHACAKSNQLPRAEGWIKRMEEAGGSWWVDGLIFQKKGTLQNYAD